MAIAPTAPNYEQPPRHWPFGPLGRTAFLVAGLLLLCATLVPFLGSIAVAAVFALGLQGPVTALTKKIGQRRKLATSLVVGLLTLLVFLPAMLVALRAAKMFANAKNQGAGGLFSSATAEKVQGALSRAEDFIGRYGVSTHIFQSADEAKELVQQAGSEVGAKALSLASAAVTSAPQIFLTFLVFLLFLYMFLAHDQRVRRFFVNLNVFRRPDTERMTQILQASAYNSLVSNFFVGIMQASIITIAARAVGFQETILIFVAVFAISYIPFIGAAPVGYALAGLSLIGGNTTAAIIMAVVATFAGLIDNVIRPYLVGSGDVKVHPVVSFASLIGAIAVFGAKGIFLGPVILTSTVSLLGRAEKIRDRKGTPSRSPENKAAAS